MSELSTTETVYVVDDDPAILKALSRVLRAHGWCAETFESAEAFLDCPKPHELTCLVLDVDLPGLDGIALQQRLLEAHQTMPIVFLTGHGDLPMCVQAIKSGASDFLAKPVRAELLLSAVGLAIEREASARAARIGDVDLRQRFSGLTAREREVLEGIAGGRLNKQIGGDLGITEQTVKFHRARIMERMQARTAAELMRMVARLELGERR